MEQAARTVEPLEGKLQPDKVGNRQRIFTNYVQMTISLASNGQQDSFRLRLCDSKCNDPIDGSGDITGTVTISQSSASDAAVFSLDLSGLTPNMMHGFHVHEKGDLSNNCKGAGGHYNPYNVRRIILYEQIFGSDKEP